ncbi:MAG: DUF134 domain-containing protein [Patescibacteria group bacterium]|jgi:predicted DNA-binding protein (UPF0251 family)|nr:DUF134 domain-containing protein [Patescibacteria group bacterium]
MARPLKPRRISFSPRAIHFKPKAIPLSSLDEVELQVDELESLRLCDLENLNQREAASQMGISQATLQRIVVSARKKITEALVKGKAIKIIKIKDQ